MIDFATLVKHYESLNIGSSDDLILDKEFYCFRKEEFFEGDRDENGNLLEGEEDYWKPIEYNVLTEDISFADIIKIFDVNGFTINKVKGFGMPDFSCNPWDATLNNYFFLESYEEMVEAIYNFNF